MTTLTPERKAQLDDYAQRHGQDPATALDEVLADALESERHDCNETVTAVMEAYESEGWQDATRRRVSRRTARKAWLSA